MHRLLALYLKLTIKKSVSAKFKKKGGSKLPISETSELFR